MRLFFDSEAGAARRRSRQETSGGEAGVALPIFCMLLLTLVLLIGLAVDIGNVQRVRRQLQRSADAAVSAALSYRLQMGWQAVHGAQPITDLGDNVAWISSAATEVAKRNLLSSNIPLASATILTAFDDRLDLVDVTVGYEVPALLFPYLAGQNLCALRHGRFVCPLLARATGQLRPANIGLVLDNSGSMSCPAAGNCDCRTNASCDPAASRMGVVLDAVRTKLVPLFNPNRDRISVTYFNLAAKVVFSTVGSAADGFPGVALPFGVMPDGSTERHDQFLAALSDPGPMGSSNQCDGLLSSLGDMRGATTPQILDSEKTFFVMLTDGATSAGRASYAHPTAALQQAMTAANVPNDFLQYAIRWSGTSNPSDIWNFPSPLVAANQPLPSRPEAFGYRDEGLPPADTFRCGELVNSPADERIRAAAGRAFTPCVDSLEFSLPGVSGGRTFASGATHWEEYKKQWYHCAVEAADEIRNRNGIVFVIGVGDNAPDASSFYQDVNDFFSRKPIAAQRIADDWYYGFSRYHGPHGETTPPAADYPEYHGYAAAEDPERNGRYLPATTVNDVGPLFEEVGRNILARLTR